MKPSAPQLASEAELEPARESSQKVIENGVKDSDDLPPLMVHPRPIVLEDDQQTYPRTVHRTTPQRMCTPEIAREMIKRWISLVPSKIV